MKNTTTLLCGTALFLATSAVAQLTPGLYESRYWGQTIFEGTPPASTRARITQSPIAANVWGAPGNYNNNDMFGPDWPPDCYYVEEWGKGWGDNTTFYYTGYICIDEGVSEVTFGCSFDDKKCLLIDNKDVFRSTEWNQNVIGTVRNLTPGWHKFDLWLYNAGSGWGPITDNPGWGAYQWHPDRIGFGIDWQGRNDANPAYFVFPSNTVDKIIFSATPPSGIVSFGTPATTVRNMTSATVTVPVSMNAGDMGTLYLCYGTSNPGVTTNGWTHPMLSIAGVTHDDETAVSHSFNLSGLMLGQTYHYLFVFVADNGAVNYAPGPANFTTCVNIESRAATRVGETTARLPVNIVAVPDMPGTLCVFYNEGGTFAQAAATRVDWTESIAAGVLNFGISGLTLGHTYAYRHAYDIAGGDLVFANGERTFTTVDETLPATFIYGNPPNGGPVDWNAPGAWSNLYGGVREVPGYAGDIIQPVENVSIWANGGSGYYGRNHTLTNDITLGAIYSGIPGRNWDGNHNMSIVRAPDVEGSVAITLNAGNTQNYSRIQLGGSEYFRIGDENPARMTLRLTQPLVVHKNGSGKGFCLMYAAITGGTLEAPLPITVSATGGESFFRFFPRNPNNDFVGDIILNSTWLSTSFFLGGAAEDHLPGNVSGYSIWNPNDAFMGHPSNRIIMTNPSCRLAIYNANANNGFILNRTILGTGMIRASQFGWWGELSEETEFQNLNLGSRCVLSPGHHAPDIDMINAGIRSVGAYDYWNTQPHPPLVSTGFGTLALRGANLNMDPATRVLLHVAADGSGNDALSLQLVGVINFNNACLEIEPFNEGEHIPSGTSWTILTTEAPAAFTGKFTRPSRINLVYNTDDDGKLLSITATQLSGASLLLVR